MATYEETGKETVDVKALVEKIKMELELTEKQKDRTAATVRS